VAQQSEQYGDLKDLVVFGWIRHFVDDAEATDDNVDSKPVGEEA